MSTSNTKEVMSQKTARKKGFSKPSIENGRNDTIRSVIRSNNSIVEVVINSKTEPEGNVKTGKPLHRSKSSGKLNTLLRRIRQKHEERKDAAPFLLRRVQSCNSLMDFKTKDPVIRTSQHELGQSCSATCSVSSSSPPSLSKTCSDENLENREMINSTPTEGSNCSNRTESKTPTHPENDIGTYLCNLVPIGWQMQSSSEETKPKSSLDNLFPGGDVKNQSLLERYYFPIPLSLSKSFTSLYDFWDSEDNNFVRDSSFLQKDDFQASTWLDVVTSDSERSLSTVGFAAIMTATVVIHPIVFMTGAATAVWAVGLFHATEKGYVYYIFLLLSQTSY